MAQTASRKRGRAATSPTDSYEDSPPKRPNTTTKRKASLRTAKKTTQIGGGADTTRLRNVAKPNPKQAKKGRKVANDAVAEIHAKAQAVRLEVETGRRRLIDNETNTNGADSGLAGSLAAQYAMHAHDPLAGCEAFEEAKRALQKFRALASRYEAVNGINSRAGPAAASAAAAAAEPTWMRWRQDAADLTALNAQAAKTARQILEGHLAPAGWPAGLSRPARSAADSGGSGSGGERDDLSHIALEILDEAVPTASTMTWGAAAAQIVDAYGSILRETFH